MLVGWKSGRKAFSNPKQNTGEDWCLGFFVVVVIHSSGVFCSGLMWLFSLGESAAVARCLGGKYPSSRTYHKLLIMNHHRSTLSQ